MWIVYQERGLNEYKRGVSKIHFLVFSVLNLSSFFSCFRVIRLISIMIRLGRCIAIGLRPSYLVALLAFYWSTTVPLSFSSSSNNSIVCAAVAYWVFTPTTNTTISGFHWR